MDQLEKNGKVSRGYMGATLGNVTADMAPLLGIKGSGKGALVNSVANDGPASKAGLKSGDVVTAIDGKAVEGSDDLTMNVIAHQPGSTVNLDVVRNGQPAKISVKLGERPTAIDWDKNGKDNGADKGDNDNDATPNSSTTMRGITVEALTPEIAQQINVPATTKGVVVDDIDQSSPAADATLGKGIVITAINRQPVNTVSDFKRLMNDNKGKAVLLTLNAGGQTAFTVVQP